MAWGCCPGSSTRPAGAKRSRSLTGNRMVPTLVLDDASVIDDSKAIVEWARANPAQAA